jgi:hypothetical protein
MDFVGINLHKTSSQGLALPQPSVLELVARAVRDRKEAERLRERLEKRVERQARRVGIIIGKPEP